MSRVSSSTTSIAERPEGDVVAARPSNAPQVALRWVVLALAAGALLTFAPLWVPIVLASWSTMLARPLHRWLSLLVRGRNGAAGVVTVVLVLAVLTPIVIMVLSLTASAIDLVTRVSDTDDDISALSTLLAGENGPSQIDFRDTQQVFELLRRHGASALGAARTLTGAAATVGIGLLVFVYAFYTFLVDGHRVYQWVLKHSPLAREHTERFAAAFEETGRGLVISLGGTSLFQGGLATLGFLIAGVPQALLLGMLTAVGSFIPVVGTALVWLPLTVALLALGRTSQAIATLAVGLVVSTLDNFVRPWLSRYGHLQLPTFVIFVAMIGGLTAFGPAGPLLGPLLVRLAVEALAIWRTRKSAEPTPAPETTTPAPETTTG